MAPRRVLSPSRRVWAPFKGSGSPYQKDWDQREGFYDHGYKQEGEHYHKTWKEMMECPLLRGSDWEPPVSKPRPTRSGPARSAGQATRTKTIPRSTAAPESED